MTAFKNTIFGKILKGASKVVLPVLGAVTGIGAITGMAKGVGALAGVGTALKKTAGGTVGVIGKVGVGAVNLLTGTTQEERKQVQAVKKDVRAATDKLEQVQRLVNAGATLAQARATVGISDSDVADTPDIVQTDSNVNQAGLFSNPVVKYGAIGVGLFVLAKILKIIK
jgi:hypothetical protein